MTRTLKDLNLCDDFLFYFVMQEPELVTGLLELTLDLPGRIEKIEYLQQRRKRSLAKRSRKYQSSIDMEILKKGEDYDKLKPQYIIFICTFDPFDRNLWRYTFSNKCHEDNTLALGDETTKVFLNTRGNMAGASKEMCEFLWFLEHSSPQEAAKAESLFVRSLSEKVEQVKESEEMGGMFMTFEDKLKDLQWEYEDMLAEKDAEIKALKEAQAASKKEMAELLRKQGVSEDIIRIVTGEYSE